MFAGLRSRWIPESRGIRCVKGAQCRNRIAFSFSSGIREQYIWCVHVVFLYARAHKWHPVRRHLLQFGAFLMLVVCLCAQVAETFDFWDRTLQTGNDIEYSLVIVVLIAGAGFGLTHLAAMLMRTVSLMSRLLSSFVRPCSWSSLPAASAGYSPPQPLRI